MTVGCSQDLDYRYLCLQANMTDTVVLIRGVLGGDVKVRIVTHL